MTSFCKITAHLKEGRKITFISDVPKNFNHLESAVQQRIDFHGYCYCRYYYYHCGDQVEIDHESDFRVMMQIYKTDEVKHIHAEYVQPSK